MGDNKISGDVKYTSGDMEATASVNSASANVVEKVELVQRQVRACVHVGWMDGWLRF